MINNDKHPIVTHQNQMFEICKPLEKLGITYFAHVNIDNDGNFTGINNNPGFGKHYLDQQYYNADIHLAGTNKFGKYIVWDAIERVGRSDQMYREGLQFGIGHVFTIVNKNEKGSDFFHFASNSNSNSINQIYLANLDLLNTFISYFNDKVSSSRQLLTYTDIKYNIDSINSKFAIKSNDIFLLNETDRIQFLKNLQEKSPSLIGEFKFTKRELDCLRYLVQGKTSREISEILGITKRTVEFYLANIKSKLYVSKKSKLIEKVRTIFI